jgi:hypothetical protein
MLELKDKILNRMGVAEAMGHRATQSARRLQQAADKHHDAANAEIADLAKQIQAKGVGQDEELEQRYCRALVTRSHMIQAGHLAQQDAGKMPEVGGKLEKGRLAKLEAAGQGAMNFEEQEHPRAEEGSNGQYKPGEFVPKEQRQEAAQAADENGFPGLAEAHQEGGTSELWKQTKADYMTARPLPPEDHDWPQKGNYPFVKTDNGAIYVDKDNAGTHIRFAEKLGIPAERIVSGGFLNDGELDDMGPRSDAGRYGDQARAQRRVEHRRAVSQAVARGEKVPEEVLADYPDLAKKEETPEEDWKKNGVRAQAFKNWFGDWENDPKNASKVVDAETGEPTETWNTRMEKGKTAARPVFHGTGKGGFRSFELSKTDPSGLVGPGFYFTENEEIARSYTAKERPENGLSRDLTDADMEHIRAWAERNKQIYQVPSILTNMDKKERPEFQTWLANRDNFHAPLKQLGITVGLKGEEKVYSCYLNIRNPIDADEKMSDDDLKRLFEHWPDDHQWKIDSKAETERDPHFDGAHEFMLDNRGRSLVEVMRHNDNTHSDWKQNNKAAIQKALTGMGYDGLTHIGGTYVGNGDTKHRVWVAWEPGQVKSSQESEGTFDPNSPDIYKALASDQDRPFVPPDMPRWRNGRPDGDAYLPLNGVEDRYKFRAMVEEMEKGTWKWSKPLIRCGDQLLTGSHRYAAAKVAGTPLVLMDVDDLFKEGGLDFKETWEAHAQPWDGWLSNMDYALKCLPQDLLDEYGVDLG